jgi:hypothetical protein
MSSPSGRGHVRTDSEDIVSSIADGEEEAGAQSDAESEPDSFSRTKSPDEVESGSQSPVPALNGTSFQGYGRVPRDHDEPPSSPELAQLEAAATSEPLASPGETGSTLETPDDTPSIKVDVGALASANQI